MLIQIKLARNQNFPAVRNGLYYRKQQVIKLFSRFNSFAKKPFKIISTAHYETKN